MQSDESQASGGSCPPLPNRNYTSTFLNDMTPLSAVDSIPTIASAGDGIEQDAHGTVHTDTSTLTAWEDESAPNEVSRAMTLSDQSCAPDKHTSGPSRFSAVSIGTGPRADLPSSDPQSPGSFAFKEALRSECPKSRSLDCTVCGSGHSFDFLHDHKGEWLELHHRAPLFIDSAQLHKVTTLETSSIIKLITLIDSSLLVEVKYVADVDGFIESDVRGWMSIANVQSEWFTPLSERTQMKLRNYRLASIYKLNRNYRSGLTAMVRKTVSRESEKVAILDTATAVVVLKICPSRTRACIRQVTELDVPSSNKGGAGVKSKRVEGWISTNVEKIGIPLLWPLHSDIDQLPVLAQEFFALARHGSDDAIVSMLRTHTGSKPRKSDRKIILDGIQRNVSKWSVHWGNHTEVDQDDVGTLGRRTSFSPSSMTSRQSIASAKRHEDDSTSQNACISTQKNDSDPTQQRTGSPREAQRKSKKQAGWFSSMKKTLIGASSSPRDKSEPNSVNVNLKDAFEKTALHYVMEYGHARLAEILVQDFHADLDLRDFEGKAPLHNAVSLRDEHVWGPCDHMRTRLIKLLLDHRADVNACDFSGKTPLYTVCENFTDPLLASVIRVLLDADADPTLVDGSGMTPFDVLSIQKTALEEQVIVSDDLAEARTRKLRAIDLVKYLIEKKTEEPTFRQTTAMFAFQDTCSKGEAMKKRRMSSFSERLIDSVSTVDANELFPPCDQMPRTPSDIHAYERLVSGMLLRNAIKENDFIVLDNLLQEFKTFDVTMEPELRKEAEIICIDNFTLFNMLADCHKVYINFGSGVETNPDALLKLVAGLRHSKGHPAAKRYARAELALKSRENATAALLQHWAEDKLKGDTDDVLFAYRAFAHWQSEQEIEDINPDIIKAASKFVESVSAVREHAAKLFSAAMTDENGVPEEVVSFLQTLVTKVSEELLGGIYNSKSYLRLLHVRIEAAIQKSIQEKAPPELLAHANVVRQYLVEEIISRSVHSTTLRFSETPENAIVVYPTDTRKPEGHVDIAVSARGQSHKFTARSICVGGRPSWNRFLDLPNTLAAGFNSLVFFYGNESLWLLMDFLRNASSGILAKRERPNYCTYNVRLSMFQLHGDAAVDLLTSKAEFAKESTAISALDSAELKSLDLNNAQELEDAIEHAYTNLTAHSIHHFYTVVVLALEGQALSTVEDYSLATTKSALVLINCCKSGKPVRHSTKRFTTTMPIIEEELGETTPHTSDGMTASNPTAVTASSLTAAKKATVDTVEEICVSFEVDAAKGESDATKTRVDMPAVDDSVTDITQETNTAVVETTEAAGTTISCSDSEVPLGVESRNGNADLVSAFESSLAAEVKAICARSGTLPADHSKTPIEHVVECLLGENALKKTSMILSLPHTNRDVNSTLLTLQAFL